MTVQVRPCWNCGTRHVTSQMPALCSDPCTAAWQQRYQLQYGDEPCVITPPLDEAPKHTNHGCNPEPLTDAERGNRALQAQAPGLVLDLYRAGQLGYLAASDEWVNGNGWPLIEPLQEAAAALAHDGQLPEFAEWFPAPADDHRAVQAVRDHETAKQQRQLGNPNPLLVVDTGEVCPPRPPEPPVGGRPLVDPRGMVQARTPWWRRWLP